MGGSSPLIIVLLNGDTLLLLLSLAGDVVADGIVMRRPPFLILFKPLRCITLNITIGSSFIDVVRAELLSFEPTLIESKISEKKSLYYFIIRLVYAICNQT